MKLPYHILRNPHVRFYLRERDLLDVLILVLIGFAVSGVVAVYVEGWIM